MDHGASKEHPVELFVRDWSLIDDSRPTRAKKIKAHKDSTQRKLAMEDDGKDSEGDSESRENSDDDATNDDITADESSGSNEDDVSDDDFTNNAGGEIISPISGARSRAERQTNRSNAIAERSNYPNVQSALFGDLQLLKRVVDIITHMNKFILENPKRVVYWKDATSNGTNAYPETDLVPIKGLIGTVPRKLTWRAWKLLKHEVGTMEKRHSAALKLSNHPLSVEPDFYPSILRETWTEAGVESIWNSGKFGEEYVSLGKTVHPATEERTLVMAVRDNAGDLFSNFLQRAVIANNKDSEGKGMTDELFAGSLNGIPLALTQGTWETMIEQLPMIAITSQDYDISDEMVCWLPKNTGACVMPVPLPVKKGKKRFSSHL